METGAWRLHLPPKPTDDERPYTPEQLDTARAEAAKRHAVSQATAERLLSGATARVEARTGACGYNRPLITMHD